MLLALFRQSREVCIRASLSFKCWHARPGAFLCLWLAKPAGSLHGTGAELSVVRISLPRQQKRQHANFPQLHKCPIKKRAEESTALTCPNTELGIWSTKHISLNAIVWRWTLQITNEFTQNTPCSRRHLPLRRLSWYYKSQLTSGHWHK